MEHPPKTGDFKPIKGNPIKNKQITYRANRRILSAKEVQIKHYQQDREKSPLNCTSDIRNKKGEEPLGVIEATLIKFNNSEKPILTSSINERIKRHSRTICNRKLIYRIEDNKLPRQYIQKRKAPFRKPFNIIISKLSF